MYADCIIFLYYNVLLHTPKGDVIKNISDTEIEKMLQTFRFAYVQIDWMKPPKRTKKESIRMLLKINGTNQGI